MRVFIKCYLIAAASVVLAQNSQELHNRYGEPDRERFAARPGISLTVEYGSDHRACSALIEPPQPLTHSEEDVPLMSSEAVTEILDEIAPPNLLGKETGKSLVNRGCNQVQILDYEDASIVRSTHNCLPLKPEREIRATVVFKREACRKPSHR
jgi:hypothetical protein